MSQVLQKAKIALGSPKMLHSEQEMTGGDGALRYNEDLLPSPPGEYSEVDRSFQCQLIEISR